MKNDKQQQEIRFQEVVGRAFRCPDGLIRWITHLSTRNYYSVLWRYEYEDVWHGGGIYKANKWEGGEEVAAPQPGEPYRMAGATGIISEWTFNMAEKD